MNMHSIIRTTLVALLCFSAGITPVYADDTDIYLTPPNVIRDDAPNILIILDNSGSMETNTIDVIVSYDPSTEYCGSNSDCFDYNKIYWKTSSGAPSTSLEQWSTSCSGAGCTPTQFISIDPSGPNNNKCESSLVNLVDPVTAAADTSGTYDSSTGYYASDRIVQFTGGTGTGNWDNLADGRDGQIECQADDPAEVSGRLYVSKQNNKSFADSYTSNSGLELTWSSYDTPTLFAGNYLNYLKFTTGTITKTRMEIAKDAVSSIINSNINVNLGMMVFNRNDATPHGGRVVSRIKKLDSAWKLSVTNTLAEVRGYVKPDATYGSGSTFNYTPLAETLYEAYLYLSGKNVLYGGINWKDNSGSDDNYPRPFPDICAEDDSNSAYCAGYDYATIDRDDIATYYSSLSDVGSYISPFQYECQQSYVIIVTDGDPSKDTEAKDLIDALPGMTDYATPITDGDDTSSTSNRLDDLAGWLYENDLIANSQLNGVQRVLTYTVGFGSGISTDGIELLQKTAEVGHGKYYTASNSLDLASSLQSAIIEIQTTTSSFAAPSLSVNAFNKLYNRDEIYFALFKPDASENWNGNIKKFRLCNTQDVIDYSCTFGEILDSQNVAAIDSANLRIKDTSRSYWNSTTDGSNVTSGGAGEKLTDTITAATRKLFTFRDAYSTLTSSSVMEQIDNASGNSFFDAVDPSAAIPGDPTIIGLPSTATTADVNNVVGWMLGYNRGATVYDSTTQRWPFGDPLHSRPVALTFGKDSSDNSIIKLIVSTNDGVVHVINDSSGKEEWAFIPKEMLGMQNNQSTDADGSHAYGLDSTPTFWIQDNNGNGIIEPGTTTDTANPKEDKVYMYIGMRRGGRKIYAFDMTPSSTLTSVSAAISPKLMWVIEGGTTTGYDRLGYTWSAPLVRNIRVKCSSCGSAGDSESKTVLIFGGGYDTSGDTGSFGSDPTTSPYGSDSRGNAIFIADPTTGERFWWASSDSTADHVLAEMKYAIPSDLSLVDSNGDGAVNRIYAGDMGGQVWRIDLDNQITSSSNGATQGYVFADLVCSRNATTKLRACSASVSPVVANQDWRKVFYSVDVVQLRDPNFSSDPEYDLVAFATGNRPDPLDLETTTDTNEAIHNRIYALRDYNIDATPFTASTVPLALVNANLENLTTNPLQDTTDSGYASALSALVGSKGWYVDLKLDSGAGITVLPLTGTDTTEWVGEKGLAKAVIFDNVLYITTYTPANNSTASVTCAATEGLGVIYALGLFDATAVIDFDGDGTPDRKTNVGGGIPSELVTVIREGGVTGLVGTSGGAASPNIGNKLPRGKTYWTED